MAFYNRVRLPIYISQPQFPVEEELYLKANGTRRVLRSMVNKEYSGRTDWMPAELHERVAIALRHDTVNIEGDKVSGAIRINGPYDIEWQDFVDHPLAPAKFKALIEAFVARNDRCGICPPTTFSIDAVNDILPAAVDEGDTKEINVAANDVYCCQNPVFSIVSFDSTYVDSLAIDPVTGVATMTLKTPLPSTGEVVFFTYRITCDDGTTDTAEVRGGIIGSLTTPCDMPQALIMDLADPFDGTAVASWTDLVSTPANGYSWYLTTDLGAGQVTVATGTTMISSVGLSSLLALKTYHFYVKSDCGDGVESPYAHIEFGTPAVGGDTMSVVVGLGNTEGEACASNETVWLATPDTAITPGATLWNSSAASTPVTGWDFVRDWNGVLYNLNSLTGVVGAATGNSC